MTAFDCFEAQVWQVTYAVRRVRIAGVGPPGPRETVQQHVDLLVLRDVSAGMLGRIESELRARAEVAEGDFMLGELKRVVAETVRVEGVPVDAARIDVRGTGKDMQVEHPQRGADAEFSEPKADGAA